jgi:sortase A
MKLATIFVVVGLFIISLYFLIEVDYYASAQTISQNPQDTPFIKIPKIGVNQSINNQSIDYGIYHEPQSAKPGSGTVILFGHRTLHGSPFLNLDKLQAGDNITLSWPGIGDVEYTVMNSTIVDASYRMALDQGNVLFLITCYPLGSTSQRLIIEAQQGNIYPFQKNKPQSDQQTPYAILLISAFFAGGMALSFMYPTKDDRVIIFIAVLILTLILVVAFIFPFPTNGIEAQLSNINNLFGV